MNIWANFAKWILIYYASFVCHCVIRNLCAYYYLPLRVEKTHFCLNFSEQTFYFLFPNTLSLLSAFPSAVKLTVHERPTISTWGKIVMVCTLQSSPSPQGQVDSGFLQSTMKIQRSTFPPCPPLSLWWDGQGKVRLQRKVRQRKKKKSHRNFPHKVVKT